jgi:hypothetical protein
MKTITLQSLTDTIAECLSGRQSYEQLRRLVHSRYESEEELIIEPLADDVLAVLAPYVEYEESFGDPKRQLRLRRLCHVLRRTIGRPQDWAVLALEYDELQDLLRKHDAGLLTDLILRQQVAKLSPAKFDVERVISLARQQEGGNDLPLAESR